MTYHATAYTSLLWSLLILFLRHSLVYRIIHLKDSRKESGLVTSSGAEQSRSLLVPGEGPSSGPAKVEGWTAQPLGSPGGLSGTQGGATTPE